MTAGLTRDDQTLALTAFGYSPAEASFMTLAALHGGHFLRRQAALFLGVRDGARVTNLVQRALALEHVQCSVWRQKVHLYHVSARPLYAALGEGDNRNRRRHEWTQIRNRVMRLDFVLGHAEARFLATERDKVAHFARLGSTSERLPATHFQSRSGARSTARFFVDKYPIRILESPGGGETARADASGGVAQFTFVDEGSVGLSRFENHLALYRPLWQALDRFELVYVAASNRHFARAETLFERFLKGDWSRNAGHEAHWPEALLPYFRLRKRYEDREFSAFDRTELLRLRDARERFAEARHEAMYRAWLAAGDAVLTPSADSRPDAHGDLRGTFRTELLRHDYSFLGGYGLR